MKPQRVALYARVSTDAQTTENQLLQLHAVDSRKGHSRQCEWLEWVRSRSLNEMRSKANHHWVIFTISKMS
jgi:DNA invertase Pin-like site-specific DNA recombinase